MSADPRKVLAPEGQADGELTRVLELFDGREVLHVTFGPVLDRSGERLRATLAEQEEAHCAALEAHFRRRLEPFVLGAHG